VQVLYDWLLPTRPIRATPPISGDAPRGRGRQELTDRTPKPYVTVAAPGEIGEPAGPDGRNSRSGTRPKAVLTGIGPVQPVIK
jgi:hypothetical protein